MSGPHFEVNVLQHIESWQWPEEAGKTILDTLRDPQATASERLIAAGLAGDLVVMNDDLAEALMAIVGSGSEPADLRAQAAISFGPVLEQSDTEGFDEEPFMDLEPHISEDTFDRICELLQRVFSDPGVPKEVRRRVLEAAVRAPQDWQQDAVRKAYEGGDREWVLTAVFAMRFVQGFDARILEALNHPDEEIHFEAVQAAGAQELEAAWPHIRSLVRDRKTPKPLLLAAIEAAATVGPEEARELLERLADSEDEEIAEAAADAIQMADTLTSGGEHDDEDEPF